MLKLLYLGITTITIDIGKAAGLDVAISRKGPQRCDQDHTVAYHRGGRTCSCNLGGLCRFHHELKQLPGWQLTQDAQGYFSWRTPAGLTYRKEPHCYAV